MWPSQPGRAEQAQTPRARDRIAARLANRGSSLDQQALMAADCCNGWIDTGDLRVTETRTTFRRFLPVPVLDFGFPAFAAWRAWPLAGGARLRSVGACGVKTRSMNLDDDPVLEADALTGSLDLPPKDRHLLQKPERVALVVRWRVGWCSATGAQTWCARYIVSQLPLSSPPFRCGDILRG